MENIFRENYVNYDEISNVDLMDIHNILLDNDIVSIKLGDKFANDWAGYSYYYCKTKGELDDKCIASFVYVMSWIMTGDAIDIYSDFKSDYYYKNDKILIECMKILDSIFEDYDSIIHLCEKFFERVYSFYLDNVDDFIKLTEQINCLVSYRELELLDNIKGKSRSEKIRILLDNYYSHHGVNG